MIVIAGTISFDPAKKSQATEAARALMAETRKEAGCISYGFTASIEDEGTFHIFEEWKTQADIDAHTQAPHMKAFGKVVPTLGIRGMKLQKYEVSSVGPLR
jgi:quinol monooxygenase YgiN